MRTRWALVVEGNKIIAAGPGLTVPSGAVNQQVGLLKPCMLADIINVDGDPSIQISVIRQVKFVMKDGVVYRQEK
ncbi:MAG: hypothetical protein ACK484_03110 [Sphingobacteriales bacterium]|jgi:hypothetical protein